jgi:hypothetical protein
LFAVGRRWFSFGLLKILYGKNLTWVGDDRGLWVVVGAVVGNSPGDVFGIGRFGPSAVNFFL